MKKHTSGLGVFPYTAGIYVSFISGNLIMSLLNNQQK